MVVIKSTRRKKYRNLPPEIWYEIFSRLSFKSFHTSQFVRKSWRCLFLHMRRDIDKDISCIPLCGLLTVHLSLDNGQNLSYLCLKTKESLKMSVNSSSHDLVVSSGYEKGFLANLSFDFTPINLARLHNPPNECYYFSIHGGLLLITLIDGTCEVHNPATKQKFCVPKSMTLESSMGFKFHNEEERSGIIIHIASKFCRRILFTVIRICVRFRYMEIYDPFKDFWVPYSLNLDDFLFSTTWWLKSYVAIFKDGVISLFILTSEHYGIVFHISDEHKMEHYKFLLPHVTQSEVCNQTKRLWECEKTLYLSCYDTEGLWIWKVGSTQRDTWEWNLLFEISNSGQLCKPMASKQLAKYVLNADAHVSVLACHLDTPLVYLRVEDSVLAYDMTKDGIEWKSEISEQSYSHLSVVLPFKPCLSFFYAPKDR